MVTGSSPKLIYSQIHVLTRMWSLKCKNPSYNTFIMKFLENARGANFQGDAPSKVLDWGKRLPPTPLFMLMVNAASRIWDMAWWHDIYVCFNSLWFFTCTSSNSLHRYMFIWFEPGAYQLSTPKSFMIEMPRKNGGRSFIAPVLFHVRRAVVLLNQKPPSIFLGPCPRLR